MKKISRRQHPYRLTTDIRQDELKFGKYLYLTLLSIIALVLVHILFGHWYLLTGDGFVYAKQDAVEVEFDAHINEVFVRNGQMVNKGEKLFSFSSLDFEQLNQQNMLNVRQLELSIDKNSKELALIKQNLAPFEKYVAFQEKFYQRIEQEQSKGLAHLYQLSTEYKRSFEARSAYLRLMREYYNLQIKVANDQVLLGDAKNRQQNLLKSYDDGVMRAPVSGVVSDLKLVPGDVLSENTRALNIFHGRRYVYGYFSARTLVDYEVGSKIVVDLPRIGKVTGRIKELLPITDKLPEEFQPKFKTRLRQQLFIVDLGQQDLSQLPIMTTVKIYRALGQDKASETASKLASVANALRNKFA